MVYFVMKTEKHSIFRNIFFYVQTFKKFKEKKELLSLKKTCSKLSIYYMNILRQQNNYQIKNKNFILSNK